jgi:hypothetical protein
MMLHYTPEMMDLKKIIDDPNTPEKERQEAIEKFKKLWEELRSKFPSDWE